MTVGIGSLDVTLVKLSQNKSIDLKPMNNGDESTNRQPKGTGIVPPDLVDPPHILPMPDGWYDDEFHIMPIWSQN